MSKPGSELQLKTFGYQMAVALPLLFGLGLPWLLEYSWPLWPWLVAAVLAILAFVCARALQPVYRSWFWLTHLLGLINSKLLLALLFYLLVLPFGLIARFLGKLGYHAKPKAQQGSYWRQPEHSTSNLKDPF
ncbi:SxtJ family membrane protein [Rheinheimera sp.]|uniref:SxtJ family membrane protein n=1 Tax=Rheinheimera sp. TaxID=1869214 RepID=UPI00307DC8A5